MGKCCSKLRAKAKSLKRFDETVDIFELPQQIREKIWRCLDNHTRKCMRLVCSSFKEEIDLGTGLKVRVDETPANLNFIKSVEVTHAVLVRMRRPQPPQRLFRCVQNLECLETRCYLTQDIYKRLVMPLNETLTSLHLSGSSLMYRSILPFEVASRANVKDHPYLFPQLLTLKIRYGNILNPATENLEVFNFNMIVIMKSFYCRNLHNLIIHPDSHILRIVSHDPQWIPKEHVEWENNPLKAFVHLHRATLKSIDLFLYSREIYEDRYDYYEYPVTLQNLLIAVPFVSIGREFIGKCYWRNILNVCSNLRHLLYQVEFWHNYIDFFDIAPTLLGRSAQTLAYIRLESFAVDEENAREVADYRRNSVGFSLHFGVFAVCVKLKVLEVCRLQTKRNYVGTDLVNLPLSLERLEIKHIFLPSEEIYQLRALPNLQDVTLTGTGNHGIFGVNFKAVKKLWTHPKLQRFQVTQINYDYSKKQFMKVVKTMRKAAREYQMDDDEDTLVMVRDVVKKVLNHRKHKFSAQLKSKQQNVVLHTASIRSPEAEIKINFLGLPERVRQGVYTMLDNTTKKTLRHVSRQVKHEVDTRAGLQVYLDSCIPGNLDFIRRTKLTWATVVAFDDPTPTDSENNNNPAEQIFQFPDALEGLTIYAPLTQCLLNSLVVPCVGTLKHLNICGSSLLTGQLEKEQQTPLEFPSLLTLTIEYDVESASELQLENLGQNLSLLFSNLKCPQIKTFHIEPALFPDPEQHFEINKCQLKPSWEPALKNFIHSHRKSLENLCIFFHDESEETDEDTPLECPTNLKHYTIRCSFTTPGSAPSDQFYWKRILCSQSGSLKSFVIRAELWHDFAGTMKMLKSVIDQNRDVLEDICIGSLWRQANVGSTFDFRVNFSVFQPCPALTALDLYANERYVHAGPTVIHPVGQNLSHLPKSLKILKISGILLRSDELLSLEFAPNLEKIALVNVGYAGVFGVNFKVVLAILRNTSVHKCLFSGFNLEQDRQQLEKFVKDRNGGRFCHEIIVCRMEDSSENGAQGNKERIKEVTVVKHNRQRGCLVW